ncbi:MAG: MaoC/PaaZ C-terminal domain-containing protein [Pseudomonadota bacterium]
MSAADPSTLEKFRKIMMERAGDDAFVTEWLHLTQDRITAFGGVTNDFDPHHIDPAVGVTGPFKRVMAQGFLTLSLLSHFSYQLPREDLPIKGQMNYGFEKVRFVKPAFVDDSFRARFKLKDVREKAGVGLVTTTDVTIESKETDDVVMAAEWLGLVIF